MYDLSIKGNLVTIVSDESAVLGLEDIDQKAALPVMEGKAKKEGVACYDTGNINYKSLGINI